ncbi:MAG: ester cyclase [Chitinophagaceae bacterium]|nr:ester cyclase [Chitinophagaceae bacterium]
MNSEAVISKQEKNKRIAKEWHEADKSGDSNFNYHLYLDDDFSADFFGQKLNKTDYISQVKKDASEYSNNKIVVHEQIAEDDKVVSMMTWTAIHKTDTLGMPVKGKSIHIKGVSVDYFKNGKVVRHYPFFDTALLLRRQAVREKVYLRIARDLHDNIGSTLGSISYYSEMAQQFTGEKPSRLKMLLDKIDATSHELVEEMSDIVWAINPQNDNFESITNRMKKYAVDLCAARNIHFILDTKTISTTLRLSIDQRKNIFLIFKEAVYNAIKYSGCDSFSASISRSANALIVELYDNGKGFDLNQDAGYNGNGIRNMKKRAEEIGAEFFLLTESGKGTQIRFAVPMRQV